MSTVTTHKNETFSDASSPSSDEKQRSLFHSALVAWYGHAHREMPWRGTGDPYHVWVSEVMLQQTQVVTAIPYFLKFMRRFPTVRELARAPLEDVLSLWRGMGYYARARNLHRGARHVVGHHQGLVPDDPVSLGKVPGIGPYTRGAILSIAFGRSVPVLDGNVARVLCRVFGLEVRPKVAVGQKVLWQLAESLVPEEAPGDYNQALMELGAVVCTPAHPSCDQCPMKAGCHATTLPDPTVLPRKSPAKARPGARAVALALQEPLSGRMLFARRPPDGLLGGMWELPTCLLKKGERIRAAARRVGHQRLGLEVSPTSSPVRVTHGFTHLKLELYVVQALASLNPPERNGPVTPRPSRRSEPAQPGSADSADVVRERKAEEVPFASGAKPPSPRRNRGSRLAVFEVAYEELRWVAREELATLPMGRVTVKALEAMSVPSLSPVDPAD